MAKNHGSSIKDDETYERLREEGYDKSKAAAIANAKANPDMSPSRKGGKSPSYEEWTKEELMERARELDIPGRSEMDKQDLIAALRD